nr:hypothetical protein CFP56_72776 [Quercus suber]
MLSSFPFLQNVHPCNSRLLRDKVIRLLCEAQRFKHKLLLQDRACISLDNFHVQMPRKAQPNASSHAQRGLKYHHVTVKKRTLQILTNTTDVDHRSVCFRYIYIPQPLSPHGREANVAAQDTHTHRFRGASIRLWGQVKGFRCVRGLRGCTSTDDDMGGSDAAKDEAGLAEWRASWDQRMSRRHALEISSMNATLAARERARRSRYRSAGGEDFTVDLAASGDSGTTEQSEYAESREGRRKKRLYTMEEMLAEGPRCLSEREAADMIILEDRAAFERLGWDRSKNKREEEASSRQRNEEELSSERLANSSERRAHVRLSSLDSDRQIVDSASSASPASERSMYVQSAQGFSKASRSIAIKQREQH